MRGFSLVTSLVLLALMAVLVQPVRADMHNPEIGKPAPAFELQGSDGKTHTLESFKGKIVVIQFQSTRCPWERAYQPILNELAKKYASGDDAKVVFLGINSNKAETMEEIKATVEKEAIPYVILKDPGNKVADAYAAKFTPHMYIVHADGNLVYNGGIEKAPSSPSGAGKSEEQYLAPALDALLAGNAIAQAETKAIGCTIKRE